MNRQIPFDATLTEKRTARTVSQRFLAPWAFAAVVAVIACTVLILDASITPEQRTAVFEQSGFFP